MRMIERMMTISFPSRAVSCHCWAQFTLIDTRNLDPPNLHVKYGQYQWGKLTGLISRDGICRLFRWHLELVRWHLSQAPARPPCSNFYDSGRSNIVKIRKRDPINRHFPASTLLTDIRLNSLQTTSQPSYSSAAQCFIIRRQTVARMEPSSLPPGPPVEWLFGSPAPGPQ